MKRLELLVLGVTAIVAAPYKVGAQDAPVPAPGPRAATMSHGSRAVIGVTTSTGSARDTLGLLVSSVTPGGPAERAGIEEGNRLASINGVNLKLASADVGDWDMANVMSRRLTRELGKVSPGAEVELRVYASGQTRTVKLRTVARDSLYPRERRAGRGERDLDDRAGLGLSPGSAGSRRDTLGVVIVHVDDDGPAARAGLEEGNRIAAINGVDLRVSREDAGDADVSRAKVRRLHRELRKVRPGEEVTLRVYAAGRAREVRVKTVPMSELPRRHSIFIGGEALPIPPSFPVPPIPPVEPEIWQELEDALSRNWQRLELMLPRIRSAVTQRVSI